MITKREAIKECKKLWRKIEKSGLTKGAFLDSPDGKEWRDKNYFVDCPLCECGNENNCSDCPLKTQYGKDCSALGFEEGTQSSQEWFEAIRGLK